LKKAELFKEVLAAAAPGAAAAAEAAVEEPPADLEVPEKAVKKVATRGKKA
jgi:hypothetical protein